MSSELKFDPSNDCWALAEAKTDDGVLFVRINETAKNYLGRPELSVRLGFAVAMQKSNGTGYPDPAEIDLLAAVEDRIVAVVAAGAVGIHVLTLTDAKMKELVFYIKPGADIPVMHKELLRDVKTHKVQCMAVHDPEWETYCAFTLE